MKQEDIRAILQTDEGYPMEWLELSDAPKVLYALGDLSLLKKRKFVVVGSRRTPALPLKIGKQIAKDLSGQFVLLTGTADGGDGACIEGALQGSGEVICMLAGGFSALPQGNLSLLEEVAKRGLLVSPHPYDTPVRAFSYGYRNKLLAKWGEGTLVLGAAEKSGALITAEYAKQFDKKVFALPYSPGVSAGQGCNQLLKTGGYLTESAEDVLAQFEMSPLPKQKRVALTEEEEKVYTALRETSEAHLRDLAEKSGIAVFKIRAVLSALEIKGLAVSLGGNRFSPM